MGWYLVGLGIVAFYIFSHIQEKYKSWKVARDQRDVALGKSESTIYLKTPIFTRWATNDLQCYLHNDSFHLCISIVCLETDELPQLSANVELARQKLQDAYNESRALAQIKEEEVSFSYALFDTLRYTYIFEI